MLSVLAEAIHALPALMRNPEEWHSLDITYHPPRVERIWRQWGKNRILLHRIHPCDDGEALVHPHPWSSAVRIVSGRYEMGISGKFYPDPYGNPTTEDPAWTSVHAKVFLVPGSEYEMTDRDGWHYVRPLKNPSDSIMVTGPLYEPRVVMPHIPIDKQQPLSPERFAELFGEWKQRVHDMADQSEKAKCPECGFFDVHPKGR